MEGLWGTLGSELARMEVATGSCPCLVSLVVIAGWLSMLEEGPPDLPELASEAG